MKVIHAIGFSTEELEEYRKQVFRNLWDGMRTLLEAMQELELRLSSEQNRVGTKASSLLELANVVVCRTIYICLRTCRT